MAAGLKGYEVLSAGAGLMAPETRWWSAAVVNVEVVLGLLLVGGGWQRVVRWVTLGCFAIFACVAGYKALEHEASCGCFGRVAVDPRMTLVFDVTILALLLWSWPRGAGGRGATGWWKGALIAAGLAVTAGVPAGVALGQRGWESGGADAGVYAVDNTLVLEPAKWGGGGFR